MFPCKNIYLYFWLSDWNVIFLFNFFAFVCTTIWVRKLSALINWWRRRRQSVAWGKSHRVWGQIHRVASCTPDHEAARECRWLTGSKQERQRSAHHRFKARWVPSFFFFHFLFFFFANSCAQRCLCDDSLQHLSSFTKRGGDSKKKKKDV